MINFRGGPVHEGAFLRKKRSFAAKVEIAPRFLRAAGVRDHDSIIGGKFGTRQFVFAQRLHELDSFGGTSLKMKSERIGGGVVGIVGLALVEIFGIGDALLRSALGEK